MTPPKPEVGQIWLAKVTDRIVPVRIRHIVQRTSWSGRASTRYLCVNLRTERALDLHRNRLRSQVMRPARGGIFVFSILLKDDDQRCAFESSPIVALDEADARARLEKVYKPGHYTATLLRKLS